MPRRASLVAGLIFRMCFRLEMESAVPLREADGDEEMVKLDLDPSLAARRYPDGPVCARHRRKGCSVP